MKCLGDSGSVSLGEGGNDLLGGQRPSSVYTPYSIQPRSSDAAGVDATAN